MGNCMSTPGKTRTTTKPQPTATLVDYNQSTEPRATTTLRNQWEGRFTAEEQSVMRFAKIQEREERKQEHNLTRLRHNLNHDIESFLLNNILFSVQFFENFHRDKTSFKSQRSREQTRMNADGPGGGLSSTRHNKRASLPDTMQEIVGRWVMLDPPILNSPTFPAKPNAKMARSRSYTSLTNLNEKITTTKELLVPLRIMVVHEDVRIVTREADDNLYRAIKPEFLPKMPGYLKLQCVGNWPEEPRNGLLNEYNSRNKYVHGRAISEEGEYEHTSGYSGSQIARDDESEYSYLERKLYDKTLKEKKYPPEEVSSASSDSSDEMDPKNQFMSPGEKLLAGIKKRGPRSNISERPPMKPPQEIVSNALPQDSNLEPPYSEDLNPPPFTQRGRRDSGTTLTVPAWPYKPPSTMRITAINNKSNETQNATSSKETDNWKLGKSANYGNTPRRLNSPKQSLSTENSDSDYGYATIPTSHTPQPTAKRHGGIPHQCLTNVRYRLVEGEDDEEQDIEAEELARQLEEKGGDTEKLFTTKTFLNPSKFLTAFAEELFWRDFGYSSSTSGSQIGSSALLSPLGEPKYATQRQGRNSKVSVDSGNGDEDDSLQACLGIPTSVPIMTGDASWFSQRDSQGMRFPIEVIPSITIPWPPEVQVLWLHGRNRRNVIINNITGEKLHPWPGKLANEATKAECHVVVPPNLQNKNPKSPKQEVSGPPDLGWKICFCEAERVLEEGLSHAQTRCLLFALLLRRCYLQWERFGLSQNFIRTAFYWKCEQGELNWPEEEMGENLKAVLAEIYRGLKRRKLPDFFIKKKNIADEESQVAMPKAQKVLHSMEEALSIHVARAISGLRFSDSRVPILDFKHFVHILTDEHAWMTLNPELVGTMDGTSEDEEGEIQKSTEYNEPHKDAKTMPTPSAARTQHQNGAQQEPQPGPSRQTFGENETEFIRTGTRYKVNDGSRKEAETSEMPKHKIKVIKGIGTVSAKKPRPQPELGDAFSRVKKTDKDKEWIKEYRKQKYNAEQKKKDKTEEEYEYEDIFAKAEKYNPAEVQSNQAKRRLLLRLFANHFEQLGRRCGRNWGAFKVADSYLRHAQNLATLLQEHEGVITPYDDEDDDGNMGEAKKILERVRKEYEYLTKLRARRQERNNRASDIGRNSARGSTPNLGRPTKSETKLNSTSNLEINKASTSFSSTASVNKEEKMEGNSEEELSSEDEKL
ncbi:uncharacterized protein LOC124167181 [Ischnura elegans]|uniref:uncharacterized protein LOC124167181 n=1 Tax=Ischnura elegans TaxID=197161 RepID=UPI001ED8BB65|nr:uncharacterized protein LOC124167181 [Ischnura elegans]